MSKKLQGKVAVVTGASKGIGAEIAKQLARDGATVVVNYAASKAAADKVVTEITGSGGKAVAILADLSKEADVRKLFAESKKAFGKIDILVCNAAVNPYYGPMAKVPDEAYERTMGANVRSNLWLCNLVIPDMAERKDGAVIIVSSVAGLKGTGNIGVYALSKAADMQLARNLAVEWGRSNVRVNCIAPSIIKTDMAKALWDNPETYKHAVSTYALGRIGEVGEVAGAAVFLAAPAGRFVTGQTIVVDGGATIFGGM